MSEMHIPEDVVIFPPCEFTERAYDCEVTVRLNDSWVRKIMKRVMRAQKIGEEGGLTFKQGHPNIEDVLRVLVYWYAQTGGYPDMVGSARTFREMVEDEERAVARPKSKESK